MHHDLGMTIERDYAPGIYHGLGTIGIGRSVEQGWLDAVTDVFEGMNIGQLSLTLRTDPCVNYVSAEELEGLRSESAPCADAEVTSHQIRALIGGLAIECSSDLREAGAIVEARLINVRLESRENGLRFRARVQETTSRQILHEEKRAIREALGLPNANNSYATTTRPHRHWLKIGFLEGEVESDDNSSLQKEIRNRVPRRIPFMPVSPVQI